MKTCITLFSILTLLACSNPKDSPQTFGKQLIGRWIEVPGDSFSLGLADLTITDSTLFFTDHPDSPPVRYEISPQDSMTLFFSPDTIAFKIALSPDGDTLKFNSRKPGRQMYFVREE